MQTTKKNILTQNNGLYRAKAQKRKDKRSQLPRVTAHSFLEQERTINHESGFQNM